MSIGLSIVLPVYDEIDNLRPLYEELKQVLDAHWPEAYEIVMVDDGSGDGSDRQLLELAEGDSTLKAILLRRNFGQTAAIAAGLDHARGDIIVLMDADRQNDPADIPRMVELIEAGNDVVSGWRRNRRDDFLTRSLPSITANRLIARVTGVRLHDFGCTLKAYRREVIQEIRLYGDMHRFIPVFAHWIGASVVELEVNHRARTHGRSKYGMGRIMRVVLDLLVLKLLGDFRTRPIHFFGSIGLGLQALGLVSGALVLYEKIVFATFAHKNPLLLLAVFLFLIGLNLLMLGLLAEMMTRTYFESQDKPIYHVRRKANLPDE